MRDPAKPAKRRTCDAAFRAEAVRLAAQSRSTQAAARALNTDPQRRCQWQKTAQAPAATALDPALDPATALEMCPPRAVHCGPAQEPELLKKAARYSQPPDPCAAAVALPPGATTPGLGYLSHAAALPGTGRAAQRL